MLIRVFETKKNTLAMTAGFFARPFGFEVNLGSSYRETPERGRMSQTLMPGERDLGVMFSFEPQSKAHKLYHLKWDAGFFNGQGASGTTDFDSHKDFISRITLKPYIINSTELGADFRYCGAGGKMELSMFILMVQMQVEIKCLLLIHHHPILADLRRVIIMEPTYNLKFIMAGVKQNGEPSIGSAHNPEQLHQRRIPAHTQFKWLSYPNLYKAF
jgi:hypothetical protein